MKCEYRYHPRVQYDEKIMTKEKGKCNHINTEIRLLLPLTPKDGEKIAICRKCYEREMFLRERYFPKSERPNWHDLSLVENPKYDTDQRPRKE